MARFLFLLLSDIYFWLNPVEQERFQRISIDLTKKIYSNYDDDCGGDELDRKGINSRESSEITGG